MFYFLFSLFLVYWEDHFLVLRNVLSTTSFKSLANHARRMPTKFGYVLLLNLIKVKCRRLVAALMVYWLNLLKQLALQIDT